MADLNLDRCFETAISLTKKAGEIIRTAWTQTKTIHTKSSQVDFVTETDQEVEKMLFSGFKEIFPDHRFIGEESTAAGVKCELTDAPTWIIDPVDGTTNFVHGFPYVSVSIGLAVKKEIVIGIVYNVMLDQMYTARKGQGAFCNDAKLEVSHQEDLSQALLMFELGSGRDEHRVDSLRANLSALIPVCHGLRAMGSAALNMCQVATGGADAYFEFGIHCWDMAAGELIVREAGGVVLDTEAGPFNLMSRRVLCAASQKLAESISKLLMHIQLEHD